MKGGGFGLHPQVIEYVLKPALPGGINPVEDHLQVLGLAVHLVDDIQVVVIRNLFHKGQRRGIYRLLDALIVQPVAAAQDAEGDQQNQRPYPQAAPVCLQSPAHFPASPPVCRLCKVKSAIWEPIQTN